ncbi:hypothetical protein FRB97_008374 [Tulasnella sp. 331]|nr:hypothetical protein FRB97_008374 [Tulasnella sp. 331]
MEQNTGLNLNRDQGVDALEIEAIELPTLLQNQAYQTRHGREIQGATSRIWKQVENKAVFEKNQSTIRWIGGSTRHTVTTRGGSSGAPKASFDVLLLIANIWLMLDRMLQCVVSTANTQAYRRTESCPKLFGLPLPRMLSGISSPERGSKACVDQFAITLSDLRCGVLSTAETAKEAASLFMFVRDTEGKLLEFVEIRDKIHACRRSSDASCEQLYDVIEGLTQIESNLNKLMDDLADEFCSVSALGGVFSPLSKARNESQKEAEDAYDMIVQTWMQVMETKQAVELYYEAFCDLKCELLSFPTPTRNKVWCKANTRRCNELYAIFNEFAM